MGHGGRVFWASEFTGIPLERILDFSSNTNAFFDPEPLRQLLTRHISWIGYYPDTFRALRSLSTFLGIAEDLLWVGNGSADLLYLILKALSPRRILIPVPTFSEYERASRAVGAEVAFLPLSAERGFRPRLEEVLEAAKGCDLLILCNPNNPTGVLLRQDEIQEILEGLGRKWLLVDEAFLDFVEPSIKPDLLPLVASRNLVLLRSLTKAFSIPGLRLGYCVGPPHLIGRLRSLSPPWPINIFAQVILENLGELAKGFRDGLRGFFGERGRFSEALSGFFQVFPSQANFLLLKASRWDLPQRLLERGILVRGPEGFRNLAPPYLRVAIKRPEDNQRFIETLEEVLP